MIHCNSSRNTGRGYGRERGALTSSDRPASVARPPLCATSSRGSITRYGPQNTYSTACAYFPRKLHSSATRRGIRSQDWPRARSRPVIQAIRCPRPANLFSSLLVKLNLFVLVYYGASIERIGDVKSKTLGHVNRHSDCYSVATYPVHRDLQQPSFQTGLILCTGAYQAWRRRKTIDSRDARCKVIPRDWRRAGAEPAMNQPNRSVGQPITTRQGIIQGQGQAVTLN